MPLLRYARLRYLAIHMASWRVVFFLTLCVPPTSHFSDVNSAFFDVPGIFGIGLVHDLSFLIFAILPLALYLTLCLPTVWRHRWHQGMLRGVIGFSVFVMLFTVVSEWQFWDVFRYPEDRIDIPSGHGR